MRGKVKLPNFFVQLFGITPAYAGKSTTISHPAFLRRDHPRVCGEKRSASTSCCALAGSPPRMRGKEKADEKVRHTLRITPAHAGKSSACRDRISGLWDHPRACGEKISGTMLITMHPGSPPRMRGKDDGIPILAPVMGITPAHAGKRRR